MAVVLGTLFVAPSFRVSAATIGSQQTPQSGSIGLEGAIPSPAPNQAATIAVPSNGQSISTIPTTISGLCKTDLLVKLFSNNIFIGSVQCVNNSYSLQVNLFPGRNDLVARVYDALDQAGPDSNLVSVTYNDAQYAQYGSRVNLTSSFARLGANPGDELVWPIVVSGGVGPYAISIDWGDGQPATLMSVQFPGDLNIKHVYRSAGIYNIIIKAVDANGTTAFLQLVGVANGKVGQGVSGGGSSSSSNSGGTVTQTQVIWWPLIVMFPLIIATFWLGRRHELFTLRRRLEQTRR